MLLCPIGQMGKLRQRATQLNELINRTWTFTQCQCRGLAVSSFHIGLFLGNVRASEVEKGSQGPFALCLGSEKTSYEAEKETRPALLLLLSYKSPWDQNSFYFFYFY